ncbi:PREDICTED: uncharacterized protein LOC107064129 [Polistes dominula]|uniref:Uncharacterized protein LOC107064129 n=1 Tax=Polistes dominula TaxID=743375 RepID=A0ABM1HVH6_POLDO|nr:PREDICTED: uncharacterized protein LOC107064129 [Polistes dominula]
MVRPSNPLLMSVVLDAVENLSDKKGSTVRDIIDFVRQNSNGSFRNLTMQIRRALKHAVNASLLRHRGGRYKILLSINPISVQQSMTEDTKFTDGLNDKLSNESPGRSIRSIKNSNSKKQTGKQTHRNKRIESRNRESTNRRKCREPKEKVRSKLKQRRKTGRRDEENDNWTLPVRRKQFNDNKMSEIMDNDLSRSNNDHSYEKISNYDSDISDDNSYDKSANSNNTLYSRDEECSSFPERKRSSIKQEHKGQSSKVRPRKRSSSRNRVLQRSNYNQNQNDQQQLEIEEIPNDHLEDARMDCEQVSGNGVEHIDIELSNPNVDRDCKPNNSGSGSTF